MCKRIFIVCLILFFIDELSAQDYLKWEPASGVPVRSVSMVTWEGSFATRQNDNMFCETAVAWTDFGRFRKQNIVIQAFDIDGEKIFPDPGFIFHDQNIHTSPSVCASNDNSWIAVWYYQEEAGGEFGISVVKITPEGEILWRQDDCPQDGLNPNRGGSAIRLLTDSQGGCYVLHYSNPQNQNNGISLSAYHVLSDGSLDQVWGDGYLICGNYFFRAENIGGGEVCVCWKNGDDILEANIFNYNLDILWDQEDQMITNSRIARNAGISLCKDNNGGAFIAWEQRSPENIYEIRIQHINSEHGILMSEGGAIIDVPRDNWSLDDLSLISAEPDHAYLQWVRRDLRVAKIRSERGDELPENVVIVWEEPVLFEDYRYPYMMTSNNDGLLLSRSAGTYINTWQIDEDGQIEWNFHIAQQAGNNNPVISVPYQNGYLFFRNFFQDENKQNKLEAFRLNNDRNCPWGFHWMTLSEGYYGGGDNSGIVTLQNGRILAYWDDSRISIQSYKLYIQIFRNTENGYDMILDPDGMRIWNDSEYPIESLQVSEGDSGSAFFLFYNDSRREPQLFVQGISPEGELLWGENPIVVTESENNFETSFICSDRNGGAFVVWREYDSNRHEYEINAQHIDQQGNLQFGNNGRALFDGFRLYDLVEDHHAGFTVLWRETNDQSYNINVNRLTSEGRSFWFNGGTQVYENDQEDHYALKPQLFHHPMGYIVTINKRFEGNRIELCLQMVSENNGELMWQEGGFQYDMSDDDHILPLITIDNNSNIWILWESGNTHRIQKLNPVPDENRNPQIMLMGDNGEPYENGKILFGDGVNRIGINLLHDGANGLWVTWGESDAPARCTHLDSTGNPYEGWNLRGLPISDSPNSQLSTSTTLINADGTSGMGVIWRERTHSTYDDLLCQRVDDDIVQNCTPFENADYSPEHIVLNPAFPNPFNSTTQFKYNLPHAMNIELAIYDVNGRRIHILENGTKRAGNYNTIWQSEGINSGCYFIRLTTPREIKTDKVVKIK